MDAAVRRYVEAKQQGDVEGAVACFADDAVVHDDGHVHTGTDAIRAWLEALDTSFSLTYDVQRIDVDGPAVTALVDVSGDFPGSPIVFRYDAEVAGDRITALTIAPAG